MIAWFPLWLFDSYLSLGRVLGDNMVEVKADGSTMKFLDLPILWDIELTSINVNQIGGLL